MPKLYRAYWSMEQRIVPGLRSTQYAYYEQLLPAVRGKRWLDVGCGRQLFPDWMARQQQEVLHSAARITGIDLDWDGLCRHPGIRDRVFGNLEKLPFAAGSFDVVSANMVVEHLERPEQTAAEIHRVLSPGGLFVFHTPNLYHWAILPARLTPDGMKKRIVRFLEGRSEEDVFRTHYRMNSAKDVRRIASVSGFEVSELKQVSGSATLAALGWAAFPELIYIRMLRANKLGTFRSNLVGVLRKR